MNFKSNPQADEIIINSKVGEISKEAQEIR